MNSHKIMSIEEAVHKQLLSMDSDAILLDLKEEASAMSKLKGMASQAIEARSGPIQIGTERNILSDSGIGAIASQYYYTFIEQKMCFPYFTED